MNWTIMFYEKAKATMNLRKELYRKDTQSLLDNYLKAKNENRILPKAYYKDFYLKYLETWTLIGHEEKKLRDVLNHCRSMLITHYKVKEKTFGEFELKMNKKWGLTLFEGN